MSWIARRLKFWSKPSEPIKTKRQIDLVSEPAQNFGPGALYQPDARTLLRESIGIPDAACRAIANRLSTLVPEVYVERLVAPGTTEDEILDDHPLAVLLRKPHPNFSYTPTFRLLGQYLVTVGEAYFFKVRDQLAPRELHVVPPGMVEPLIRGNVVRAYLVTDANGRRREYPETSFVRFVCPDPENIWRGEGLLGPTGLSADTHKFAGQHLRYHYQNDATPKTVLEATEDAETWTKEELAAFYDLWRESYTVRGGSRMGLPALTPIGYKLVNLPTWTGKDIAPLMKEIRDDILLQYGVPRSVLGQVLSGDRSSAETNQWIFDRYAVLPFAQLVTDAINAQLVPDFGGQIRFRFQTFVSEDQEFKLIQEKQDLETKVRSVNMVRQDRGLGPVPWGDVPIGQAQDVPYTGEEPEDVDNEDELTEEEAREAEHRLHTQLRLHFARRRPSRRQVA